MVTIKLKSKSRFVFFSALTLALLSGASLTRTIHSQEAPSGERAQKESQTFALETYARRSFNYCNRMVDKDGLPYFNIFWTEPAEAAHDWPDFGDGMPRQFQAVVMARHMTGETLPIEAVWRQKILNLIDPETGFLTRPQTNFSKKVADEGDQGLVLYALATAYADKPDEELKRVIIKIVDRLLDRAKNGTLDNKSFIRGFSLKSLMTCVRVLDYEPALKLAELTVKIVFSENPLFTPDNTFKHGGHMHGNLRTLVGAADYALYVKDPVLYSRVDALYRYVRSEATRFGFLPEVIGRKGDIVGTETCALMDYVGLAVTLANHGHPEYWGDVERVVRNQLVESQAHNLVWLKSDPARPDTGQFTWNDIAGRMEGGWAGWSSPTHLLAARESLDHHWGGPELHGKTRAFQNCCGGSGIHALFIAWKNAARFRDGTLSVDLHMDKQLPQAEIRGYQPFKGLLTIHLKETCAVRVRIPDFVEASTVVMEANGAKVQAKAFGNYLELGQRAAGEMIRISYPLPVTSEEVEIGNPGFRHYRYRVTWKGDTVIRMEPLGKEYTTGYSEFDNKQVPIFYGNEGPSPLYQRKHFELDTEPSPSALYNDNGTLDFWANLGK